MPRVIDWELENFDGTFGKGWLALTVRRVRFIEALRSGKYRQGNGGLWMTGWAPDGFTRDKSSGSYCCIGVACQLIGVEKHTLDLEMAGTYELFRDTYGITDKQQRYLIGMNDGTLVRILNRDQFGQTYGGGIQIRRDAPSRVFSEIARFLEVLWRLTPSDVPSTDRVTTN